MTERYQHHSSTGVREWFHIELDHSVDTAAATQWCIDNFQRVQTIGHWFCFESEEHAALFKLAWVNNL